MPIAQDEILDDVECGAVVGTCDFHVHARDERGKPIFDMAVFKDTVRRIKARLPKMIIRLSTAARVGKAWATRANPLRLLPEEAKRTKMKPCNHVF